MLKADEVKRNHPGCGVEKLYYTLKPDFIGRDKFIDIFMLLGYRLKPKKNYLRTTIASKTDYTNLIKGMTVDAPSTIWQSDITYIKVGEDFYYAVFIIDIYTKKIVGYKVDDNMRASANISALKKALRSNKPPKIHHSDRGSQYTSKAYTQLLQSKNIEISMAYSAQDNAYAERINRTIKCDYIDHWQPKNFKELKNMVKRAVKNYNELRPHNAIFKMNPCQFENYCKDNEKDNKLIFTIFNNEENNIKTVNPV